MLLRIQPEESLRSYVERNLYLGSNQPQLAVLNQMSKCYVGISEAKAIATVMNWHGCSGFNRLIHNHTDYFIFTVFKDVQDISYSHKDYISGNKLFGSHNNPDKFCPACVKADVENYGFSYWRRGHSGDLTVCAEHNVRLLDHCPFCGLPFSRYGHGLDVMWKTCHGQHLADTVPTLNTIGEELRRSRFFFDTSKFGYHISMDAALSAIRSKVGGMLQREDGFNKVNLDLYRELTRKFHITVAQRTSNDGHFLMYSSEVYGVAQLAYETFSSFLKDLPSDESTLRPIDSLWDTYRSGGYESANYIQENYKYGAGIWMVPFPHETNFSGDYEQSIPLIFPCCNLGSVKKSRLKPRKAELSPPRIPLLR